MNKPRSILWLFTDRNITDHLRVLKGINDRYG